MYIPVTHIFYVIITVSDKHLFFFLLIGQFYVLST
jgi:hypothetical protein